MLNKARNNGGTKRMEPNHYTELEFENNEDTNLEESITKREILTEQGDPEIDSLYRKWKEGDLDLQPEFQRGFVWDIVKASCLIESILLEIPLPVIYLSQEQNDIEYVIDGQQRLTTFFSFIDGTLPDPKLPNGKDFRLTKLNVLSDLNGKRYRELTKDLQKKIKYAKVRTITLKKQSDPELKFEVFERLNTGSVQLNDQELRNCIYRGSYNSIIKELSEDHVFKSILGIKKPEKRMKDVELVLRFAAFFNRGYQNYKPPIKSFLNLEMEENRNISDNKAKNLRAGFKTSVELVKAIFGANAFKRYYAGKGSNNNNGHWEKTQFNNSLFDIVMDSLARIDKNKAYQHLGDIRDGLIDLMTSDQEFINSIELSTSSSQAVKTRFVKWNAKLQEIIKDHTPEQRLFPWSVKEQLFKTSKTCAICNNRILDIDDAHVDHIMPFSRGGKTTFDNAQLTHKYCNLVKNNSLPAQPIHEENIYVNQTKQSQITTGFNAIAQSNETITLPNSEIEVTTEETILKNEGKNIINGHLISHNNIEINSTCFKIDKYNAYAMINGYKGDGVIRHTAIWVASQTNNCLPALITLSQSKRFKISDLGKRLNAEDLKLPYKYVATLEKEYFIKNDIEMWNTLCSNGLFDIWAPESPYKRLDNAKSKPSDFRILLLRIYEIDREYSACEVGPAGDHYDKLKTHDNHVTLLRPVIADAEFKEIKNLLEQSVTPYLSK